MTPRQVDKDRTADRLSATGPTDDSGVWHGWFDGAALPNPGKIGIGVVLISPDDVRLETSARIPSDGCSNEAELHALIAALEFAATSGARRLKLRGDSLVAITHVTGEKHTKIARLMLLIAHAQGLLAGFEEIQLLWLPRHRNAEADMLSRTALGLPVKTLPQTKTGRRRKR